MCLLLVQGGRHNRAEPCPLSRDKADIGHRRAECPLMTQSGYSQPRCYKRTSRKPLRMSASDLKQFRRRSCPREPHQLGDVGHCGGRDDGCAAGTRDDGDGTGAGLRAGAAGGCDGSGTFISISTTADSSLAISRDVWS